MSAPERIIRLNTVLARTGLSRSTLYRTIAGSKFPPQLKISTHAAGWKESDIARWVADPVRWGPEAEVGHRGDDGKRSARARPANDNRPPDGQDVGGEADTFERLDALVLTIARLTGRRIAREDYEKVMRAANDNAPPSREGAGKMQMM